MLYGILVILCFISLCKEIFVEKKLAFFLEKGKQPFSPSVRIQKTRTESRYNTSKKKKSHLTRKKSTSTNRACVAVAGEKVTAVRLRTNRNLWYTVDTSSDRFFRDSYTNEEEFLRDLYRIWKHVKKDPSVGQACFEVDTLSCCTRVFKPGVHVGGDLGICKPKDAKRVVKQAYVEFVLGGWRYDVTERVDRCAGPQNDFFARSGGLITTQDVLFPLSCLMALWRVLKIEWADGRDTSVFRVKDDDVITVPGKLYPSVEPFVAVSSTTSRAGGQDSETRISSFRRILRGLWSPSSPFD